MNDPFGIVGQQQRRRQEHLLVVLPFLAMRWPLVKYGRWRAEFVTTGSWNPTLND